MEAAEHDAREWAVEAALRPGRAPHRDPEGRDQRLNATLLVAALSLVLGIYMSTRDDGITLLSTLVNFGGLSAFLVLHVSVVVHYVVRQHSRDWWRHLVVPVIGFLILAYVVVNAQVAAQNLGFVWLVVGLIVLGVLLVRGRRPDLAVGDNP